MVIAWNHTTGEWAGQGVTDGTGSYTISLEPGFYQLFAYSYIIYGDKLYASQWYDSTYSYELASRLSVREGQTTSANFDLAPGGAIAGTVTKHGTTEPIANLPITVWHYMSETWAGEGVTSDGSGTVDAGVFIIAGLVPGEQYRICAETEGTGYAFECYNNTFFDAATPVTVEAGLNKIKTGINFSLTLGGSVSGQVTREGTAEPIADIQVNAVDLASGYWAGYGLTDDTGAYIISGLAPGRYWVYASASGMNYLSEYYEDTPDYTSAKTVKVEAGQTTPGINFGLAQGGGVAGRVTKEGTALGIEGLYVAAYKISSGALADSAWTDDNGEYEISGLAPGQYRIRVFNQQGDPILNYISEWYDNVQQSGVATPVDVVAGTITMDKNFSLAAGASIMGTVTQDITSVPIYNVYVYAYDFTTNELAGLSLTNKTGNYNIAGLAPGGKYRLHVYSNISAYVSEWYKNTQLSNSATVVNAPSASIDFSVTWYPLTILTTSPLGLQVVVDGKTYMSPSYFGWTPGSSHTINVLTPQTTPDGTGRQFVYGSWNDGKAKSHAIKASTLKEQSTVYMAKFDRMIGDMDVSHAVDIRDAILALQVVAGMAPASNIKPAALFYGDKIGFPEALYIIQKVAGFRQ